MSSVRQVMVRYRVKPGRTTENEALVRAVYEELAAAAPAGFRYATFKLDDDATFVHLAVQDDDGPGPLAQLAAFRAFVADIGERCDEPPVLSEVTRIGAFRLYDG